MACHCGRRGRSLRKDAVKEVQADKLASEAWNSRMLGYKGPGPPPPTVGDAINAGYFYLEVRCLRRDTNQTVAHQVALDLGPGQGNRFIMEPPVSLCTRGSSTGITTLVVAIGNFVGLETARSDASTTRCQSGQKSIMIGHQMWWHASTSSPTVTIKQEPTENWPAGNEVVAGACIRLGGRIWSRILSWSR